MIVERFDEHDDRAAVSFGKIDNPNGREHAVALVGRFESSIDDASARQLEQNEPAGETCKRARTAYSEREDQT